MLQKSKDFNKLVNSGIIAVLRKMEPESMERVAFALIEGGVTTLEITVDTPQSFNLISKFSKKFQGKALIGAGTVYDGYSAYKAIQNGADFIFAPNLNKETIKTTLRYGKIIIPGIFTPTEALTAIECGADAVKVFPASSVGSQFIKDMKGPFPHIPIIPTGGVNLSNIGDFIKAGALSVGVGNALLDKKLIKFGKFDKIRDLAIEYNNKVQENRLVHN